MKHQPTCAREVLRQADDSAAYLSERCTCAPAVEDSGRSAPEGQKRLVELARETAFDRHHEAAVGNRQKKQHSFEGDDEDFGFKTCPHPDCVLVRAALLVPQEEP